MPQHIPQRMQLLLRVDADAEIRAGDFKKGHGRMLFAKPLDALAERMHLISGNMYILRSQEGTHQRRIQEEGGGDPQRKWIRSACRLIFI